MSHTLNLDTLRQLPLKAAALIGPDTWTQGQEKDSDGRMCLTGALRYCDPQPGDFSLALEVFRRKDRAEEWNDDPVRTWQEVHDALMVEITETDLAGTFGPQWKPIVALVRRAAVLTPSEAKGLGAARSAARDAARSAAWDAAQDAALGAAWSAALDAALGAAWDAALDAALDAARGAARGLVVRDLIGQRGFVQAHYDTLTGPWARAIGPVHPDDVPATSSPYRG